MYQEEDPKLQLGEEQLRAKVLIRAFSMPTMTRHLEGVAHYLHLVPKDKLVHLLNCNDTSFVDSFELSLSNIMRGIAEKAKSDLPPVKSWRTIKNDELITEPVQIVEGLFHRGSKVAVGAPSKMGKSWMLLGWAICVSLGLPVLGRPSKKGRVLYINWELEEWAVKKRILAIRKKLGLQEDGTMDGELEIWSLRDHPRSLKDIIETVLDRVRGQDYSLIVLDPVYKAYGGRDENKAADTNEVCAEMQRIATVSRAAVVFASHYSKGNQSQKNAVDRISGSGVIVRDADVIATFTEHKAGDQVYTAEFSLRNFEPLASFVVEWQHPAMILRPDLQPGDLKTVNGVGKTNGKAQQVKETPMEKAYRIAEEKRREKMGADDVLYKAIVAEMEGEEITSEELKGEVQKKFKCGSRWAEVHIQQMCSWSHIERVSKGVYKKKFKELM